ncbi:5'-nucleotidase domain-containing protein 1-like isoform X3 [Dreissena polymorpha]|uniref:5'-nucleotidase domain-containing protein 1-like isoform X3 n=1 Tax=Dreissena polymorpha TaxID=45954 RepID=UPI002264314F|nr:5'-nucleotidase domain-containing protein 1-like isoform X3 [Dreissena polymorpha]
MKPLSLINYHAIGFDLDHTLAKYRVVNQIKLTYNSLIDFLVQEKGYDSDIRTDISYGKDFICKGLFVDTAKGNVIKLSHSGKILRGSHGTRALSQRELISTYGPTLLWEHYEHAREAVRPSTGNKTFAFWENYFDVPALYVCAQVVDYWDKKNGGPLPSYRDILFKDILAGMECNYRFQAFSENSGYFFPKLKQNPEQYYQACSLGVKQWLRDLKMAGKCVFLTTSSHIDFASLTASSVLGPDWKSYFDIIVTNARKPGFFKDNKPFLSLDGILEKETVTYDKLEEHSVYSSGNHGDLEKFITKVVYFGDSLCSDAFPVKTLTDWDLILVLEEMEAEGFHPHDNTHHYWQQDERDRKIVRPVNLAVDEEEEEYLLSRQWGSFFYHPEDDPLQNRHMNTFWGELVTKYSDVAIPSIEYIAGVYFVSGLPLDHEFTRFDHSEDGSTDGFSPAKPKPLLPLVLP